MSAHESLGYGLNSKLSCSAVNLQCVARCLAHHRCSIRLGDCKANPLPQHLTRKDGQILRFSVPFPRPAIVLQLPSDRATKQCLGNLESNHEELGLLSKKAQRLGESRKPVSKSPKNRHLDAFPSVTWYMGRALPVGQARCRGSTHTTSFNPLDGPRRRMSSSLFI